MSLLSYATPAVTVDTHLWILTEELKDVFPNKLLSRIIPLYPLVLMEVLMNCYSSTAHLDAISTLDNDLNFRLLFA